MSDINNEVEKPSIREQLSEMKEEKSDLKVADDTDNTSDSNEKSDLEVADETGKTSESDEKSDLKVADETEPMEEKSSVREQLNKLSEDNGDKQVGSDFHAPQEISR